MGKIGELYDDEFEGEKEDEPLLTPTSADDRVKTTKTEIERRKNSKKRFAKIAKFCIDNFDIVAGTLDRSFTLLSIIVFIGFFYHEGLVRWIFVLCSGLSALICTILILLKAKYGQGKILTSVSKDSRIRDTLEEWSKTISQG
jgi:hypothetical protein